MAATTEIPKNEAVVETIKKEHQLETIYQLALKAVGLLPAEGRIKITGDIPGQKPLIKYMGGGSEDENLGAVIDEINSLAHTLADWALKAEKIGEEVKVAISVG